MARGGVRPGAGRPKGAANLKTREIADLAAEAGITPLEVMLHAMRMYVNAENWNAAAMIAKDAAPYMHPKLSSIEHGGGEKPIQMENEFRIVIVDPRSDIEDIAE